MVPLLVAIHLVPIAVCAVIALLLRKRWMAILFVALGLLGIIAGFVPIWLSMKITIARGGPDPGNAGVLWFCSIPLCTMLGVTIGGLWGYFLDEDHQSRQREDHTYCQNCGYAMHGLNRLGCPKCGWTRTCPQCGYPMRGLMKTGCPECGWQRAEQPGNPTRPSNHHNGDAPQA